MNERGEGREQEIQMDTIHPVLAQYLTAHLEMTERDKQFLVAFYNQLKKDLLQNVAEAFKPESRRLKENGKRGKEFRDAWGTKTINPKEGPNATAIFLETRNQIKKEAAKTAIAFAEMKNKAEKDTLTGLYRGEAFENYAQTTLRISQETTKELNRDKKENEQLISAYVAFDIDNFKTVNDTIGHVEADKQILSVIGQILLGSSDNPGIIRSTDIGSRIGGDEFVVLFTRIRADSVKPTVARLLKTFQQITYKDKDGIDRAITVSAGVKIIENNEEITLKGARHMADEAANLAKIEKNAFLIYSPDLTKRIEKMIIEDANKPDEQNHGLIFYLRQQTQLNKRAMENITEHNPLALEKYTVILKEQARINLETKLKEIEAKKSA